MCFLIYSDIQALFLEEERTMFQAQVIDHIRDGFLSFFCFEKFLNIISQYDFTSPTPRNFFFPSFFRHLKEKWIP